MQVSVVVIGGGRSGYCVLCAVRVYCVVVLFFAGAVCKEAVLLWIDAAIAHAACYSGPPLRVLCVRVCVCVNTNVLNTWTFAL